MIFYFYYLEKVKKSGNNALSNFCARILGWITLNDAKFPRFCPFFVPA